MGVPGKDANPLHSVGSAKESNTGHSAEVPEQHDAAATLSSKEERDKLRAELLAELRPELKSELIAEYYETAEESERQAEDGGRKIARKAIEGVGQGIAQGAGRRLFAWVWDHWDQVMEWMG